MPTEEHNERKLRYFLHRAFPIVNAKHLLPLCLLLSFALHSTVLWIPSLKAHFKPKPTRLTAHIQILPEKKNLPQTPPLILPQPAPLSPTLPVHSNNLPNKIGKTTKVQTWQEVVQEKIRAQQQNGLFYPPEAIAQNLEGVVEVLIFLNENGTVLAARVETSSGFPLLDEAALVAARALKSLPLDAPEEILLPIVFRLE